MDTNVPLSSQLTLQVPSGDTEGVTLLLQPERLPYSLFPVSLSSYTCYLSFIVCLYFSLVLCSLNFLSFNFPPQGHFSPCSYMLRVCTDVVVRYSCVALFLMGFNSNQSRAILSVMSAKCGGEGFCSCDLFVLQEPVKHVAPVKGHRSSKSFNPEYYGHNLTTTEDLQCVCVCVTSGIYHLVVKASRPLEPCCPILVSSSCVCLWLHVCVCIHMCLLIMTVVGVTI